MRFLNKFPQSTALVLLLAFQFQGQAQIQGVSTATGVSTGSGTFTASTGALFLSESEDFKSGIFRWPKKSDLNIKKLESHGFKLVQADDGSFSLYENKEASKTPPTTVTGIINSSTLVSEGLGTNLVLLGRVYVTDIKEVYEWCDKDFHQYWLDSGEISKEELLESIKAPGQAAGKGYYVSMDLT